MIKDITDAMKVQMVKDMLSKDSKVDEVLDNMDDFAGEGEVHVYFVTTDIPSCEESGTGYWSDDGYEWGNHGLSSSTELQLQLMGYTVDYNDCEGCENEGYIVIK